MENQPSERSRSRGVRVNLGLGLSLAGFLFVLLGANPDIVNLDRSPFVGLVQTATFSFGLGMICLGGFLSFKAIQPQERTQSLAQDVGLRLVATGYLVSLVSGMADIFGFGTQTWPSLPWFGPTQAAGVVAGEVIIALGFLLYLPFLTAKS